MKEYLDLLPEFKKSEIRRGRLFRAVIFQEISFLFPVAIFVGMLLATNLIIDIQSQGVDAVFENEQKREENRELLMYEDKFREINSRITVISGAQAFHLEWSGVLSELNSLFPEGVYVDSLSTKELKMFLVGRAKNRDDILKFQESLKNSKCFSGVNVPFSNLVSKEDVDFQIDININRECLTMNKNVLEKE